MPPTRHEAEQMGLFSNDELKNELADEPWKKSQTDKMLDLYLAGAHPIRIAQELGRNPKAVKRRLEQFTYNEKDRAVRYEPFRRVSRKGKKLTQNERVMIQSFQERKLPMAALARVLMRDLHEIDPDTKGQRKVANDRQIAPTLDLVLAHRYIYHIWKTPIISDKTYDDLKAEEIEYGTGAKALAGSPRDCPRHIKSLALYLVDKSIFERE